MSASSPSCSSLQTALVDKAECVYTPYYCEVGVTFITFSAPNMLAVLLLTQENCIKFIEQICDARSELEAELFGACSFQNSHFRS